MITKASSKTETLVEFGDRYFESSLAGDLREFDRYTAGKSAPRTDTMQRLLDRAEMQTVEEIRKTIRQMERIAERKSS